MVIYINNEEVLCDKNIIINEEMLNTSSVILNNVYPKSWETTHDYTTNYYYPQDYSLCAIYGKSKMPKNYEEVTYIQSVYNESNAKGFWIGQNYSSNIKIDITFEIDPSQTGNGAILGDSNGYVLYKNGNELRFWHTSLLNYTTISNNCYGKHRLIIDFVNNIYILDGVSNDFNFVDFNLNYGLYLFSYSSNDYTYSNNSINVKIYNCKIIDENNSVTGNYVPCLYTNNKAYLYDLVNNVPYPKTYDGNPGNSDYIAGEKGSSNSSIVFSGVVKNTGNISLNPRDPHYSSIEVLSFKTFLSEGETLELVLNNMTVSQCINKIINEISDYGFIPGNIQLVGDNTSIGAYSCIDKTPYDVFQYLADISGSRWSCRIISTNKIAVDFYDPSLLPQGNDIEYTNEYFDTNNIIDITYSINTGDYRNKQIMTADQVYGSVEYTERFISDGYTTTYNTSNNIGTITYIYVNNEQMEVATTIDKDNGISADFYYNVGTNEIEYNEDNGNIVAGVLIEVIYTPLVQGRVIQYNNDEKNRIQNQLSISNGSIERYENRSDTTSSDELAKIGASYLYYKGVPEVTLTIQTDNIDLIDVGQITFFNNAPIDELKQYYMCKKKTIEYITSVDKTFYTFELSSSYNSENAINYFDNQRAKQGGNLQVGENVDRNIDIESSALITFYGFVANEVSADNNILNAPLNAPFVQ